MKNDKQMIVHLNKILGNELIAINQYFLHSKMLQDWGLTKLAALTRAESIDEMKHADMLCDRILMSKGLPNLQELGRMSIGQTVKEMFESDLKLEIKAIADLKTAIAYAESTQDFGSRDMLQSILISEEEHQEFLETQLDLLERIGEQNYSLSQM